MLSSWLLRLKLSLKGAKLATTEIFLLLVHIMRRLPESIKIRTTP